MAKFYSELDELTRSFIRAQHLFFVASAAASSRVNLSPKGMDCLRILSDREVAYLDLTGSGNETAAHIGADGRLTLMFCSFDEKPLILRLYGRGEVVALGTEHFDSLSAHFDILPGTRQIIRLEIESVQTSCGFAVPFYEYRGERDQLVQYWDGMEEEKLAAYRARKNGRSIDGLPTGYLDEGSEEE